MSIELTTGDMPSDIFSGFLPADNPPPEGETSVS
jgi:hypothetical protein